MRLSRLNAGSGTGASAGSGEGVLSIMRRLFKASNGQTGIVSLVTKLGVSGLPRDLYLNLKIAIG